MNQLNFGLSPPVKYFTDSSKAVFLLWIFYVFFSVLCLLCLCACLYICALWSPAGKGLTSWLSFVVSNCEFFTRWTEKILNRALFQLNLHGHLLDWGTFHVSHYVVTLLYLLPLTKLNLQHTNRGQHTWIIIYAFLIETVISSCYSLIYFSCFTFVDFIHLLLKSQFKSSSEQILYCSIHADST